MANRLKSAAQTGQVRIIAGQWRGRRLGFPDVKGLRPSGDRVRETLFNWLQGELVGAHCLDLFAGSGALGFEAASRQAASVVMIEQNIRAFRALEQHCQTLGTDTVELIHQNALSWLKNTPVNSSSRQPFDIVFLDPPFDSDLLREAITALTDGNWLAPQALIYTESSLQQNNTQDQESEQEVLAGQHWQLHRHQNFSAVEVKLYRHR